MIRAAIAADAPLLGTLHVHAWQRAYRGIFPDEFLDELDIERRIHWFSRAIDEGREILVAESGGSVTGFSSFGTSRGNEWGELYAIYVHPDHWGEGHGHGLITATEQRLGEIGFDDVLLWVIDSNSQARRFYERQGWMLARPVKIEEIGGIQVTEVRYEKDLRART